jgi:ribonuclease R
MKKKLLAFFKKNPSKGFKSKEIAKLLDVTTDHEYESLKALLYKLVEEEVITKNGKKYKLNVLPDTNRITGELVINQGGYGFVMPKNKETGDIFIAARNISAAFSGDIVEVTLFAKQKGKNLEGQVVKILKRKREEIVGTLSKSNSFYFVKPDEPQLHRDIYINNEKLKKAKTGDKVVVGNIFWNTSMLNPEGEIVEVIGTAGTHDTEITSLAREFNLPYKFTDNVIKEAVDISEEVSEKEIKNRIDFRKKNVFTIDPYDAKDFDDALSLEFLENGNYSIGIHIADVSHYVKLNSMLDKEAFKRGNSVYFVGKVIPMLPEQLSNNICSLVPYKDRLTYSVITEITPRGRIIGYTINKTVINSKRRFTYEEAQDVIETGEGDLKEEILALNALSQNLRKKRLREGSIEFTTPEIKFTLDENGKPLSVEKKVIKESNMLVEEFMLLANKLIAGHIAKPKRKDVKPFVYRIHDLPDSEKMYEFARFVKSLGYSFNPSAATRSNQLQLLMMQVKGTEEESLINELGIRSMAKAVYSPKNIGHYGLGFKFYTHFTSPIRRYSDLIVHRVLFEYLENNQNKIYSLPQLEEICEHISQTERNAIEAERLSVKLKQIEYLQEHLGEEFHAIISGITHFGIFVKITEILAEGLIRLRDIESDFYVYDEKNYSLIGKRSKKQFRLGDKIQVKLIRVDKEKSELDFIILEEQDK